VKEKVYISGAITNDVNYKEKFAEAENVLKKLDYTVMNPAVLPLGFTHKEYLKICFAMIDVCDTICMLSDWKDSEGAQEELIYATSIGKDISYFEGHVVRFYKVKGRLV